MNDISPTEKARRRHQALASKKLAYDALLQSYLARVVGYSLTGSTREQALFFAHGIGANGKSTFINTIAGVIGDYHRNAPIETFTASSNDRHPTELAGVMDLLDGKAVVPCQAFNLVGGHRMHAAIVDRWTTSQGDSEEAARFYKASDLPKGPFAVG